MDQRIRLLTAGAVMVVGVGLALLFRRSSADSDLPIAMQSDPQVVRKQPDARTVPAAEPAANSPRGQPAATAESRRTSPTVVTPVNQPAPPPDLPKYLPSGSQGTSQTFSTRWGTSLNDMLPETASAPAVHKVVDGDTLGSLAERYLGSASRAMEIYEANRGVLTEGPNILRIGTALKIPRAGPLPGRTVQASQ
jgi:nucleoid-associated protein YgaU